MAQKNGKASAAALLSLILATGMTTACGSGKEGQEGKTNEPPQEPVELVLYYPFINDWDEEGLNQLLGEPLKKKFPYMTPKFIVGGSRPGTGIAELIAAGQTIDIIFCSIGATPPTLLDQKLEFDISPLIKKAGYDLSKLEPTTVDMAKQIAKGGMYGLPAYVPPSALYYNKDVFDKFGVAYPKDGMNWDDLEELNKKLTRKDGDTQYYGMAMPFGHLALMNARSLNPIDPASEKAVIHTDGWKKFADNFIRYYTVPGYEKTANALDVGTQVNRFFKDRNTAMFLEITGTHAAQLEGMNFDIATFPVFKDAPSVGPQPYPTYYYITNTSKYKDQAFEAISYFTSEEFQLQKSKEGKILTVLQNKAVRESFGQDVPLFKGKNTKAMLPQKYGSASAVTRYNSIATTEFYNAVIAAISGAKDLNTALRDAEETANQKIQTAKPK
ncbi:ABC transporter substrate-binding protein [Paenibacillus sp. GCM10012303]|uniref:ABC transporter substrate-binding protein n=1 Tax=Paenibacillus sp. GCM10012303 TaxID=3317340 RepID=UPI003612FB80